MRTGTLALVLALTSGCAEATQPAQTTAPAQSTTVPPPNAAGARPAVSATPPPASPPLHTTPGAFTTVQGVAFSDASHGWAVGSHCSDTSCDILFSSSADGGRTWAPATTVARSLATPPPAVGVRFSGRDGWIFGPGVYGTHDGGRTWKRVVADPVTALEPSSRDVWAIRACGSPATGVGVDVEPSCTPVLLASAVGSDTWAVAGVQPPVEASRMATGTPFALLERAPAGLALIAEPTVSAPPGVPGQAVVPDSGRLMASSDLGRSWQLLRPPCTDFQGVRSPDGVTVWLLCAAGGGAGSQAKEVDVSVDRGRSWQVRAANALPTTAGSIPFSGYADTLVAPTPSEGSSAPASPRRSCAAMTAAGGGTGPPSPTRASARGSGSTSCGSSPLPAAGRCPRRAPAFLGARACSPRRMVAPPGCPSRPRSHRPPEDAFETRTPRRQGRLFQPISHRWPSGSWT